MARRSTLGTVLYALHALKSLIIAASILVLAMLKLSTEVFAPVALTWQVWLIFVLSLLTFSAVLFLLVRPPEQMYMRLCGAWLLLVAVITSSSLAYAVWQGTPRLFWDYVEPVASLLFSIPLLAGYHSGCAVFLPFREV